MKKSKKIFIFLSLVIALIDGLFVSASYFYTKRSFENSLQENSQQFYAIYKTVLESTYNGLSIQAKLFSGNKNVQDLFLLGKKSIQHNNGDEDGKETDQIRKKLYQLVVNSWQEATKNIDTHLFHFHFGPGALSFLRVHEPDKFGDRLDDLRFIIVDTNAEHTARSGFETGRTSSGFRSVEPVFAWDPELNKKVYVGALEVGMSYEKLLQVIDNNINLELSILLNNQHIKNTIWDEFITDFHQSMAIEGCNCVLVSSSRPGLKSVLEFIFNRSKSTKNLIQPDHQARVITHKERIYSYTLHPLRDYLGDKDPSRYDVGTIFIAKEISKEMNTYREAQLFTLFYGLIAYLLIELLLIVTFFNMSKLLLLQIKQQNKKLIGQKKTIQLDKVKYKNLIGAVNNNYFFYTRTNKQFSFVTPSVKKILGFTDVDFLSNAQNYLTSGGQSVFFQAKPERTFLEKKKSTFEVDIVNKNGRLQNLLITETKTYSKHAGQKDEIEGLAQDISQPRQEKMLLLLRCNILQMIADNYTREKILNTLTLGIESIIQDISCSVMLIERQEDKHTSTIRTGAAPSIDISLINALSGQDINSAIGSCGVSASTSQRKIISNMLESKSFKDLNEIILKTPYKACWSEPVLSSKAKVMATIDIYYNSIQKPKESDFEVMAVGISLVSSLLQPSAK